ncbi:hypothetical protein HGRIS_001840 [Hohenbuehelia grisea]|uniref:Mitochondrial carrier protein n=1 Tax=Hohenbuehelia grisea TaxID=104357 RepID=A0ABR3JJS0_9AGAR
MTSTLPPIVQAVSGAIGSASSNALVYPLDLITTRLQLECHRKKRPSGVRRAFEVLCSIVHRDGSAALYDGLGADTGATLLSNFFYFYFYSFLRSAVTTRQICLGSGRVKFPKRSSLYKPNMLEELILGFLAGVASRAISMPLNIVTLRLQTERRDNDSDTESDSDSDEEVDRAQRNAGLSDVFRAIYKEQGLAGFWRGFRLSVILSINPSLSLAFFQLVRRISRVHLRKATTAQANLNPTPREAFIGGAISNSIGTHPIMYQSHSHILY